MSSVVDGISRITDPQKKGDVIGRALAAGVLAGLAELSEADHDRVVFRIEAMEPKAFRAISEGVLDSLRVDEHETTAHLWLRSGPAYARDLIAYFLDDSHFEDDHE